VRQDLNCTKGGRRRATANPFQIGRSPTNTIVSTLVASHLLIVQFRPTHQDILQDA